MCRGTEDGRPSRLLETAARDRHVEAGGGRGGREEAGGTNEDYGILKAGAPAVGRAHSSSDKSSGRRSRFFAAGTRRERERERERGARSRIKRRWLWATRREDRGHAGRGLAGRTLGTHHFKTA